MNVRPAAAGDVEAIAHLEVDAFPDDAWTPDYLRVAVEGKMPTVRILVAEVPGADGPRIAGHALVSVVYEIAELQRIATVADRRRSGIGQALLGASIELARVGGAERMLLEVREDNLPAIRFYDRAGFVEIDRRERYYRDGATGIVLALELAGTAPTPG